MYMQMSLVMTKSDFGICLETRNMHADQTLHGWIPVKYDQHICHCCKMYISINIYTTTQLVPVTKLRYNLSCFTFIIMFC